MGMGQTIVGLLAWILIGMFLWEVRWKARSIILALVALSAGLHLLGDADSVYLLDALGFAIRVGIACVYLIKRKMVVVS